MGALLAAVRDSHEHASPIGNKQPGPRPWGCRDMRGAGVMVGIPLLENIHEALAANHVDAAPGGIVKQIVRVAHDFDRCGLLSGLRIDHQHAGRRTAAGQQAVVRFIERHRIVLQCGRDGPTAQHGILREVHNLDFFLVGDVHEGSGSVLLQLKRFRVRIESDLARLLSVGIQKCQCAVAIADDNTLPAGVI